MVTLLEYNTDSALVVSDVSYMDETELEETNLIPIPTASPTSFDLLLDNEISALEVGVLKWTYPEDRVDGEEEDGGGEGSDDLSHLYDDTMEIRSGLGSNEELTAENLQISSTGNLSLSPQEERKADLVMTGSNGGLAQDHTYVNLQQQTAPAFSSDDWTDKEKQFFEEDEDAG